MANVLVARSAHDMLHPLLPCQEFCKPLNLVRCRFLRNFSPLEGWPLPL